MERLSTANKAYELEQEIYADPTSVGHSVADKRQELCDAVVSALEHWSWIDSCHLINCLHGIGGRFQLGGMDTASNCTPAHEPILECLRHHQHPAKVRILGTAAQL